MSVQKYHYTNESYSGCDMVATILMPDLNSGKKIVYSLGEIQTISYSIHMDRRPIRSIGNVNAKDYVMGSRTIAGSLVFAVFNKHFANKIMKDIGDSVKSNYAFLMDELPPFDIVISFANEYGLRSRQALYGVRLVNEGQVMSINDIYTENTYQFVATDIEYLTDENGYANYSGGNGSMIIVDTAKREYEPEYNNDNINNDLANIKNVKLTHKVLNECTQLSDAIVQFSIEPRKDYGVLIISGTKKFNIDINNIEDKSKITVQLKEGTYEAVWVNPADSDEISNLIKFKIVKQQGIRSSVLNPPVVDFLTSTDMTINANCKRHDKIIIKNRDNEKIILPVNNKRIKIENLKANTEYMVYSINSLTDEKSESVTVKTLGSNDDIFDNFILYIKDNKKMLISSFFEAYENIIEEGRELYLKNNNAYVSLLEVYSVLLSSYINTLSNLSVDNFNDIYDYEKEVEKYNSMIEKCREIILLTSDYVNDKVFSYNINSIYVPQPILEHRSFCTDYMYVDNSIKYVEIYKYNNGKLQLISKIQRTNFIPVENSNYYKCYFCGKPGNKYCAYAYNDFDFKSPRVDFFIYDDLNKALYREKYVSVKNNINSKLFRAEKNYGEYDLEDLTIDQKNRTLTELLSRENNRLIKAPLIESINSKEVKIYIDEPTGYISNSGIKLSISRLDNALYEDYNYKRRIVEGNLIKHSDYGLKAGKSYAIWFENKNGHPVSKISTFTIDEFLNDREIDYRFIKNTINNLKRLFRASNIKDVYLNNILNSSYNSSDYTRFNILDSIFDSLIDNSFYINDFFEVLYIFLKYRISENYDIDENFFNKPISCNNDSIGVMEDNIIATIITIQNNTHKKEYRVLNSGDNINLQNNEYTIIYFAKKDFTKRSGFIIINKNKGIKIYKTLVEVGE